ncbi:hypothetical protein [Algibacter sp. L4_22]|nr:hypothetical protein [Algibacter sp. L4_22]MCL5129100.1 hypothetical protein [Algibacter sp. L4_22]
MEKIYSKESVGNPKKREPSKETVNFILSYSKALKIVKYKHLEFETLLN